MENWDFAIRQLRREISKEKNHERLQWLEEVLHSWVQERRKALSLNTKSLTIGKEKL